MWEGVTTYLYSMFLNLLKIYKYTIKFILQNILIADLSYTSTFWGGLSKSFSKGLINQ